MALLEHYQHAQTPVTYKGVIWPSYMALATHYGLYPETVKRRLALGQPLEIKRLSRWK